MYHNLARSWRSRTFDEIKGQELAVRLIKNSLFKNAFAPVYLFSGARGCGKTSMGRLFASAINCQKLAEFQQQPQAVSLPCLSCASCLEMQAGSHPDFIEIDAASYTGVDHVRTIIEAASLLPILGRRRIYLIDEAHMLSKAAFNALLKILEEPPMTALFILATTEAHKVLETVRSRCFQLFFDPLDQAVLVEHLKKICTQEGITFEEKALWLIAQESGGCVRDAINCIERGRLAGDILSSSLVNELFGHIDDTVILELVTIGLEKSPAEVLTFWEQQGLGRSAVYVWRRISEILVALVWMHNGVIKPSFEQSVERIRLISQLVDPQKLLQIVQAWHALEPMLHKTASASEIVETALVGWSRRLAFVSSPPNLPEKKELRPTALPHTQNGEAVHAVPREGLLENEQHQKNELTEGPWALFLKEIGLLADPLLLSVFRQASFQGVLEDRVRIAFPPEMSFFHEILKDARNAWLPLLKKTFSSQSDLDIVFQRNTTSEQKKNEIAVAANPVKKPTEEISPALKAQSAPSTPQIKNSSSFYKNNEGFRKRVESKERILDVSDIKKWQKANLLLSYFPGTVTVIKE
jgi:DNA polymerase III subunit gamma/tau